jgi:hypothetical protein
MDRYAPENRLLLTYEGLTDNLIGPEVAKGLNEFLGKAKGVTPISSDSVACVWRAVVKNEPPEHQKEQIERLQAQALDPNQRTNLKKTDRNLVEQPAPLSAANIPGLTSPPIQPKPLPSDDRIGAPSAKEQYLLNSATLMQTPKVALAELARPQEAQLQKHPSKQQAPTIHGDPAAAAGEEVDPLDALKEKMEKVLARGKELQAQQKLKENQEGPQHGKQQPQGGMQEEMPRYDLSHRRLDPGHHNSQRSGPDVPRPYLPRHLDSMMDMLMEVANRYEKTDVRLYHIMMGYCEQIRSERAKLNSDEPLRVKSNGGFY